MRPACEGLNNKEQKEPLERFERAAYLFQRQENHAATLFLFYARICKQFQIVDAA
jgi:hypothetical protein